MDTDNSDRYFIKLLLQLQYLIPHVAAANLGREVSARSSGAWEFRFQKQIGHSWIDEAGFKNRVESEGVLLIPVDQGEEREDFLFYQVRIDIRVLWRVMIKMVENIILGE